MTAFIQPARFSDGSILPGLFDVITEDGETFRDLTIGQLRQLTWHRGWELVEV